ncbi:endoplasmic reticulum-golgi intermediate compartment protein 2 [Quercus suber]|uniref:Endoplasmic reticulum-golgi intermediate compartment protein 2 n=1 Tax=Quercus suber TaxID=58331 RepID=A0AAW0JZP2_QUESU
MRVKQAIKSIDAFPRAEDHLLQKTQSGALVSVVGLAIMALLFLHELRYYLTTYTVHQMSVDLKRGETLPIHINMTFPSLPCDDGNKDEHEDSDQKFQFFDQAAENMIKKVKQALAHGEGCRVYGVLDVQRVAGNFHISVHGLNIYVAQMIFEGSIHVNISHIIHDLSFGPKYPGIHNPLDGTERILHDTSGTFKYYIKV